MSLGTAFKAFFAALSNQQTSDAIRRVLDGEVAPAAPDPELVKRLPRPEASTAASQAARRPPVRSDAVTLLSMLQREARLIDLVQEPLEQYSDAQVGAAARPCLKQCQQTLRRVFDLQPLIDQPEGATVDVPTTASPVRYQWTGEHNGSVSSKGRVVHPGWLASRCELAQWTGDNQDANIIAPVQVEP